MVGEGLCQGKIDYKTGGIFNGLFLGPEIKYCLTIDNSCIIQEHKTFKVLNDSKRFSDRFRYSNMIEVKKISTMLPNHGKNHLIMEL